MLKNRAKFLASRCSPVRWETLSLRPEQADPLSENRTRQSDLDRQRIFQTPSSYNDVIAYYHESLAAQLSAGTAQAVPDTDASQIFETTLAFGQEGVRSATPGASIRFRMQQGGSEQWTELRVVAPPPDAEPGATVTLIFLNP